MTRKRSAYRPRTTLADPVSAALQLSALMPAHTRQHLAALATDALDRMRRGVEPAAAWAQLADACNVAEVLADAGICSDPDSRERIRRGHEALAAIHGRSARSWTMYPAEVVALDQAVWLHGVQLEHCTRGEFERSVQTVAKRMRQALAGNAPAGAKVCH